MAAMGVDAAAADTAPPDQIKTIAGRYEIDLGAPLGGGGLAFVYPGKDLRTRRPVALKTLRIEYRHDPETRARFRREARLLAFLAHPNVIRVFDFVEDYGTSWVVLERTTGGSLHDLMAKRGPLPVATVARMLDQTAAALAHLHGRGLVHLDVNPHNLLLTGEGQVKLIDFGLAQPAGAPQQTVSGHDATGAAYLAPEQVSGEPVAATTDVYALGCLAYALLTGQPPFATGAGQRRNDLVRARLEGTPVPPSRARPDLALPGWVDDVVLWALAKAPGDRYGSVTSFAEVFRSAVDGEPVPDANPHAASPIVDVAHAPPVAGPRLLTPTAASARTEPSLRRAGTIARLYRGGGQRLRRAGRVRRLLWRTVLALLLVNVLLALLLYVTRGEIPGLYEPAALLGPGGTGRIVVDDWRIRDAPSLTASTPLWRLDAGEQVAITGAALPNEGRTWWPVRYDGADGTVRGFAAGEGLTASRTTPWERVREAVASAR